MYIPICVISAMSQSTVIGDNNDLPWKGDPLYKWDMEHFKSTTINNYVIMGYRTFESMHKKPLQNRINYVISHNDEVSNFENLIFTKTLEDAIKDAYTNISDSKKESKIFIIGGEKLYTKAFEEDIVDEVILSVFTKSFEGNKRFPVKYLHNRFQLQGSEIKQNGRILLYKRVR